MSVKTSETAQPPPTPAGPSPSAAPGNDRLLPAIGSTEVTGPETPSRVVAVVRAITTAATVLLILAPTADRSVWMLVTLAAVVVYAAFRVVRPIAPDPPGATPTGLGKLGSIAYPLIVEAGAFSVVVALSGLWQSPFVFCLVPAVVAAGAQGGYSAGVRMASTEAVAVSLSLILTRGAADPAPRLIGTIGTWTSVLVLVGLVAGHTRQTNGAVEAARSEAAERLDQLNDANGLLAELNRVAQRLPASLDLGQVIDSTAEQLRLLVGFDVLAICLLDEQDHHWTVRKVSGAQLPGRIGPVDLPPVLRLGATAPGPMVVDPATSTLLGPRSTSALVSPLRSREEVVGLLLMEREGDVGFGPGDVDVTANIVGSASVAVENAQLFSRLRTVGADEERNRIARDLHDRVGQSLAYLGIEVDRLIRIAERGEEVVGPLRTLREDIRGLVREVRNTLYDLRTEVSDRSPLVETLHSYLQRVEDRSGIAVEVELDPDLRLPLRQERELFRIVQEAVVNTERHASALHLWVQWHRRGQFAELLVRDDGRGFIPGRSGRPDSYGVLGMRERATAIGAQLSIESAPGEGTCVRCAIRISP